MKQRCCINIRPCIFLVSTWPDKSWYGMALALNSSGIVLGVQLPAPNLPAGVGDFAVYNYFKMDPTLHYHGKLHIRLNSLDFQKTCLSPLLQTKWVQSCLSGSFGIRTSKDALVAGFTLNFGEGFWWFQWIAKEAKRAEESGRESKRVKES